MSDKSVRCQDCGKEFTFTEQEQSFYAEKGFQEPKRCRDCRSARKKQHPKERRGGERQSGGQGSFGNSRW